MDWLARALLRHLARRVHVRRRSDAWIEFSEYELVTSLGAIIGGLGYDVFPEWRVGGRRVDLRAMCPRCSAHDPDLLVEAKLIWEGDQRFNAERFNDRQEILKDFAPTSLGEGEHGCHLVVWLIQSRNRAFACAKPGAKSLGLADAITLVEREHARLVATPEVLDVSPLWSGALEYRFLHVYLWAPFEAADADHQAAKDMLELIGQAPMSDRVRRGFVELARRPDPAGMLQNLLKCVRSRGDVGASVARSGLVSFESVLPAVEAIHQRWAENKVRRTPETDDDPATTEAHSQSAAAD